MASACESLGLAIKNWLVTGVEALHFFSEKASVQEIIVTEPKNQVLNAVSNAVHPQVIGESLSRRREGWLISDIG